MYQRDLPDADSEIFFDWARMFLSKKVDPQANEFYLLIFLDISAQGTVL